MATGRVRATDRVAAALDEAALLVQGSPSSTSSKPSVSPRPTSPQLDRNPAAPSSTPSPALSPGPSPRGSGPSPRLMAGRERGEREDSRGRSGQLEVKDTGHVLTKAASVLAACRAHWLAAARRAHFDAMAGVADSCAVELVELLSSAATVPTEAELRILLELTLARHALLGATKASLSEEERADVVRFGSASITAGQLDALVTQLTRDLASDEALLAATRAEIAQLEAEVAQSTARLTALSNSSAAQNAQKAVAEEEAELDRALAAARAEAQELAHRSHALRTDKETITQPVFALDISAGRAVRHEGWLVKQGHIVRSWKRRFFSLAVQPNVSAVLYYFKAQSDLRPAGLAELRGCTVGELPAGAGFGPHAFHVSLPSGRVYFLRADSAAERSSWIIEIQKAAFG